MNKPDRKEHRDRLVTLAFVSVLLVLFYGPGTDWFVGADRALYDALASRAQEVPLADGVIVTIDPASLSADQPLDDFGEVIGWLQANGANRIIVPSAPPFAENAPLPEWAESMAHKGPIYTQRRHPLAMRATKSGFVELDEDNDGILRAAPLWQLIDGVMTPSLAVTVALANPEQFNDPRLSNIDDSVYLTGFAPLPRIDAHDLLNGALTADSVRGRTVLLDAAPPATSAVATLPSGQFATLSDLTAALLADIEGSRAVVSPSWVRAMEWLIPALLAIVAALFMPGRKRRYVIATTLGAMAVLLLAEALLLYYLRVRMDLGRPMLLFLGAGLLVLWLAGNQQKTAVSAFRRGSDFLAAGRLEPAFAEFRRCEPTETLAAAMYKLSLAFEDKSQPERAEEVLQWLKQTHRTGPANPKTLGKATGVPERLGRYVIERKLGRGAMGAVYLARDPRINRSVALKVIPLEKEFEDEELKEARVRFFREAESAGRLAHPNIVTVYDAGEDKHLAYIAMEYLKGAPLTEFTDPQRLLAPGKALELCARTADALDYAHNQGVIHRDIKPANILYNLRDDTLKISDFGVARLTDNNRTKTGIVLGTPMYMSPEQLNAEKLTGQSDLFSLGVTLYELLTGEAPFKADNIAALMANITTEDPPPISNRRAGVPPSVDAVLLKAMAKSPENRFASGGEMAVALRNCARYASPRG